MDKKTKALNQKQANAEKVYKINQNNLPVCCPMPDMVIWNSHPRVYIPLDKTNLKDMCPYCGAQFELQS